MHSDGEQVYMLLTALLQVASFMWGFQEYCDIMVQLIRTTCHIPGHCNSLAFTTAQERGECIISCAWQLPMNMHKHRHVRVCVSVRVCWCV